MKTPQSVWYSPVACVVATRSFDHICYSTSNFRKEKQPQFSDDGCGSCDDRAGPTDKHQLTGCLPWPQLGEQSWRITARLTSSSWPDVFHASSTSESESYIDEIALIINRWNRNCCWLCIPLCVFHYLIPKLGHKLFSLMPSSNGNSCSIELTIDLRCHVTQYGACQCMIFYLVLDYSLHSI